MKSQLIRAFRGTAILRFSSQLLAFLASVVAARVMGANEFGAYGFAFAIISLLAIPSQLGMPGLLVRETAASSATRNWGRLKGVWYWSNRAVLISSVSIALITLVLCQVGVIEKSSALLIGLIFIPVWGLNSLRSASLRGLGHLIVGQIPDGIVRPLVFTLMLLLPFVLGHQVSAGMAMAGNVVAGFVAFIVGACVLLKHAPSEVRRVKADLTARSSWRVSAANMAAISGMQVLSNQISILILGVTANNDEVAALKVAISAGVVATVGIQLSNIVLSPKLAAAHAAGDKSTLQTLVSVGALVAVTLALPVFMVFLFFGEEIISIVYGSEYAAASVALVILMGAQLLNAATGSAPALLMMTGYEKSMTRLLIASSLTCVVVGLILVPLLGLIGAALVNAFGIAFVNVLCWYLARKKLGLDASILSSGLALKQAAINFLRN